MIGFGKTAESRPFVIHFEGEVMDFNPRMEELTIGKCTSRVLEAFTGFRAESPRAREKQRAYDMMRDKKHLHRHNWIIPLKEFKLKCKI